MPERRRRKKPSDKGGGVFEVVALAVDIGLVEEDGIENSVGMQWLACLFGLLVRATSFPNSQDAVN
jgi:hypothetical protein